MNTKSFKQRVLDGEAVLGTFLCLGDSVVAEMIGALGYDWVLIDLEHGLGSEQDALLQMQAVAPTGTTPIVRVESKAAQRIYRILDSGAQGIMCPHVDSAAEAAEVVSAMRYPPVGKRGVAKLIRGAQFGATFDTYAARCAEELLAVVQIETRAAVENVQAIARTEGVDVLFIGPSDLSMDLGIHGQFDHPLFIAAVKKITDAAKSAGKAIGILLFTPDDYAKYYQLGIRFFACEADAVFLREAALAAITKLKAARDATAR